MVGIGTLYIANLLDPKMNLTEYATGLNQVLDRSKIENMKPEEMKEERGQEIQTILVKK
jgi:hypothetical protein